VSEQRSLQADCANCVGLCCVATVFAAAADFAIDKRAGEPCLNLQGDFRCGIHAQLRERGFAGCAVFDCFGAGQHVTRSTFAGVDWRTRPAMAAAMFAAFGIVRQLHELLWYVSEALELQDARSVHAELRLARAETERLADLDRLALVQQDVEAHRQRVNPVLRRASELVRRGVRPRGVDLSAADLVGKNLRRSNMRGANLRGARLVGATLRGVDLSLADLTGADLRGADVSAANLSASLFVTQAQLESAVGDGATRLPSRRTRPAHWSAR